MSKSIYLDYAAATPLDEEVLEAMKPYFSERFENPSAVYLAASHGTKKTLEEARHAAAKCLGTRPAEIVFTAGATEANNLAIQGLMNQFPDGEVIVSAIEHPSVIEPAKLFNHRQIPVDDQGIVDLVQLERMVSDKTVLVSVMLVNNELGTIQPVNKISQLLNKLSNVRTKKGNKRPLYFHTDAAQAGSFLDLHVPRLGVDFMSLNGGKIYGPKQSGLLYVRAGIKLKPMIVGGGQEFGLRAGTENLPADVGLVKALTMAQARRGTDSQNITKLREEFEKLVLGGCSGAKINGHPKKRGPHITSITFPGIDSERLMMQLDEAGVQAAVGSACSASSDKPSPVLAAIGLGDDEARATLRFSFGRQTTGSDIKKTAEILAELAAGQKGTFS